MAKIDPLTDITLFSAIAENNDKIEQALENTLSRDGSSPNGMAANLDMNSYRILNLPNAVQNQEPVTLSQAASIAGVTNPLSQENVGGVLYPRTTAETSAGVTPTYYYYPPGDVRRYGAVGDGVTDDSTALQAALSSTHNVKGNAGDTYLLDTLLTQSTNRQVIDFSGCTVKRGSATAHSPMLTASGDYVRVTGGKWDGNSANQSPDATQAYAHCAVSITGDYCTVENMEGVDHDGFAVKGVECSYLVVRNNLFSNCGLWGVYIEGLTADRYGNEIVGNTILSESIAAAGGIYLTSENSNPPTYVQYDWRVADNTCKGSTSTPTGIGITTRGYDGVISNNQTTGYTMGVSADVAVRTVISGNRVSGTAGATSYGIECNGGNNAVTGNVVIGSINGIAVSGADYNQDYLNISGNYLQNPSSRGIYVVASAGKHANHINISGNTVILTGATTGRTAVTLANDCKYAMIGSNNFVGPGSGISSCRGVYLDNVVSHVAVIGNRFSMWERPFDLYAAGSVTYTDITFSFNDCTYDMPIPTVFIVTSGSASVGARVVQMWNNSSNGVDYNMLDLSTSKLFQLSATYATPESNVTGAIGSLYINTNGGAGTTLFVKESGSGNTGWVGK